MSHQRPIPEAAQSPYPLQPPPIAERSEAETSSAPGADVEDTAEAKRKWTELPQLPELNSKAKAGLGAAIGIGSAALLAALLYSRRGGRDKASRARA